MLNIYREIIKVAEEGGSAALATVISTSNSTPRGIGVKMLVRADGSILGTVGGGSVEKKTIKEALESIRTGKPKSLKFNLAPQKGEENGMICGGEMEIFVEPIVQSPVIYIFGGGHVSLVLTKIAHLVGFRTVVIDNRAEYANTERFPEAEKVVAEDYEQAFDKIKLTGADYVVIMTTEHKHDERVLGLALGTQAKYIGMMGSNTKFRTIYKHLLDRGIAKKKLDKVHTPIGLEISAETPAEIAISIMAEIIKIHRKSA